MQRTAPMTHNLLSTIEVPVHLRSPGEMVPVQASAEPRQVPRRPCQPASQIGQSLHSRRDRGDRGHFCEVRRPPPRAAGAFFLRVVGEFGFHYIAVEILPSNAPSSLGRVDAAVRAVVAAGPVSHPIIRSALSGVLTDIGRPSSLDLHQIAAQRRAICAFGVGLAPSRNGVDLGSRPARGKCLARHREAQWVGVTPDKTRPRPRDIM
jgi:hypothetical protein